MYIVGIYMTYDGEMPMYIFETEEKAKEFIKDNYYKELEIAEQEENLMGFNIAKDYSWARIDYVGNELDFGYEVDFIEWNIGSIYEQK
jgi:hypothetical protein